MMKITILLFDHYTALDIIGPYEVLSKLPGSEICFVGYEKRDYSDSYGLKIPAGYSFAEVAETDILMIPGGPGIDALLNDKTVITWIQKLDRTSTWTVSVCSGTLLLAAAGLLNAKKGTTHWRRKEQLKEYNVAVIDERYVQDGKIITSAGVSAGIDMALYLVSKISGEQSAKMIQLGIEYDPQPPFDCGTPDKAPKELVDKLKSR
jgi:transcriptional regulator GlxA family with amidase domain